MGLFDTLAAVVRELDLAGVPHMISGSIASAHHGEARATQDIDIVIDPSPEQMAVLVRGLRGTGMYVGDGESAMSDRSQFNVIDTTSGWKVDLIVRKDRDYSREEFARRQAVEIGPVPTFVTSPEDSILTKLEWAADSGSERQQRDVRAMPLAQGDELDWRYLNRWASELGVLDVLQQLRSDPS